MKSKILILIFVVVFAIIAIVFIKKSQPINMGAVISTRPSTTTTEPGKVMPWNGKPDIVACTMDAKACPDGSFVGRGGPDCQFAACPNAV